MIKVFLIMVCVKCSRSHDWEEVFSQKLAMEVSSAAPTVSSVASFLTTDSTDFAKVLQSDFFVDKTLLINDLMDSKESFLEISTAPHFGKSTNLDMIKSFLEINVDEKGNRVIAESTENYKAFTQNNLRVTVHKQVLRDHFGKHPVLSIDFKPLEMVTKFDPLLRKFRQILLETFSHYKYLLESDEVRDNFTTSKNDFVKYSFEKSNLNLNQSEIEEGFPVLSQLLFQHFGVPVVVLIDNYDMIVDAPVSEDCRDDVYSFVVNVTDRLLGSRSVSRAILTGSTLRGGIPHSPRVKSALQTHPQLLRHYGLSRNELSVLLGKILNDTTEIEDAMNRIVKDYSGYVRSMDVYDDLETNPRHLVVCSVWSVVQYLTCVRKINVGNVGESPLNPSITYLSIADRARLTKCF